MNQSKKLHKVTLSKGYTILLIVFLVTTIGLKLWQHRWPDAVIQVGDEQVDVLVAKTPWHWQKGLGDRETIAPYDGMLFVFPIERRHVFVMRDTLFSIDIVWFNNGKVVDIAPNVPTEIGVPEEELVKYIPRDVANAVVEFPAGWAFEHGLEIGDSLRVISE